jgi:hypothetical protein
MKINDFADAVKTNPIKLNFKGKKMLEMTQNYLPKTQNFQSTVASKPANRKINKLPLRLLHSSTKPVILLNDEFNALNDLAK